MDTNNKILIVGAQSLPKNEIAERLVELDDSLNIAAKFTSNPQYIDLKYGNNDKHLYYNDNDNINLDYKNNALLYIFSNEFISEGVTLDEFYSNEIIPIDIEHFNTISDKVLSSVKPIIVWVDTKQHSDTHIIKETKFLMERLNKINYMYFLYENTSIEDMCDIVLKYLNSDEVSRKSILKDFS